MTNPDPATTTAQRAVARLACPRCGSTRLSSVEHLTALGRCRAITVDADGAPTFHWTGWTDVEWDSSTTVGLQCDACLHTVREGPVRASVARFARQRMRPRPTT